jgi:class 3 adenylate cyclase/tetratricopeptide (TPR) repeat protein
MICSRCGANVANNKKFCGDCGTPLQWQCSACGSGNPADKRFCGDCGAARGAKPDAAPAAAATMPSPERRLLSVMFIDLVGSTAIGERLDPEDLRKVIATFHSTVKGLVTRFEGFIARYMGDGVLVYFGYPQANEADVERAIRAALSIVEAVAALNTLAGPPGTLRVRIGVHTGLVVAGDLIGSGASLETAVVGDTPNLAARLQAATEPGTVLISEATRLLVGNLFEYRELAFSKLKGARGIEHAWIVLRESLIDSRYEALHQGQSSLVGRTEELEFMLRRWEQAKTGDGRVVLLTGDPGIGKSRLVAALDQCISASSHSRLRFFCSPHHVDTPLYPIVRHLERAANFQHGDSPATKWDKLANALPPNATPEDKALLADLISISSPAQDLMSTLRPEQRKARTFATVIHQIDRLAGMRPTLIVFEDIHWADPSTLELLHHLIETVRHKAMLLVVTARPEVRPAWAARPHVTTRPLSGLDRPAAVTLIKQVAGGRELPQNVIDAIIAHGDSMPLFIEELTKTVLNEIQDKKLGDYVPSLKSLSIDLVPRSLYSSLMARLDRLPRGKEVAQIGAVIGREFSFDLMQQLVSTLSAKQLEETLAELSQADIIIAHGHAPFANYAFRHALVQDAAYGSLLHERRRAIHLRVAEEIEKDSGVGIVSQPQLIAWHFAEAGAPSRAIDYYQKAAESATGRFALAEMVNHLRNGLRQVSRLPDSPERNRRELALQLTLGQALIDFEGGNSEAVRETFERARELCFSLDEMKLLPRVYDGLVANYHYIRANPEKISQYTDEITTVHRRTGDPRALLVITRAECLADFLLGRFEAAREHMQSLLDMYDAGRDGPLAGMTTRDPRAAMTTFLGICLTILGHADSGTAKTHEGLQYAKKLNHPVSLNLALRRACVQNMLRRDPQRVLEFSRELATLCAEFETYQGTWEGTFFEDWSRLCTESEPVRFDRMRDFLEHIDRAGIWALLPFYMASAAELRGRYGDVAAASALLERADEVINITNSRWCSAEIMRLRARFSAHNFEEAAALLRGSLALAREQHSKLWELRAASDLAELLRDQRNYIEAREVLNPVCEWFNEGKDTADYIAARTLLHEIEELHKHSGEPRKTGKNVGISSL